MSRRSKPVVLCSVSASHGPAMLGDKCVSCLEASYGKKIEGPAIVVGNDAAPLAHPLPAPGEPFPLPEDLAPVSTMPGICGWCGDPSEGRYRVYVGETLVKLCTPCGAGYEPTYAQIVARVREREASAS